MSGALYENVWKHDLDGMIKVLEHKKIPPSTDMVAYDINSLTAPYYLLPLNIPTAACVPGPPGECIPHAPPIYWALGP